MVERFANFQDDLENEDNIENEDNLENNDDLKNNDDIEHEEDLECEKDLKPILSYHHSLKPIHLKLKSWNV